MQKQIVTTIDDVDGKEIDGDGRTVTFALDGQTYELDLRDANITKLEKALAPFIDKARKVKPTRRRRGRA